SLKRTASARRPEHDARHLVLSGAAPGADLVGDDTVGKGVGARAPAEEHEPSEDAPSDHASLHRASRDEPLARDGLDVVWTVRQCHIAARAQDTLAADSHPASELQVWCHSLGSTWPWAQEAGDYHPAIARGQEGGTRGSARWHPPCFLQCG